MAFLFVLDLVLRFVPIDPLTFRAWEAMLRRYPNAEGPFAPNKHYHRDNSYGGIANIGNLPAQRHYRAANFTTDANGFHNPPSLRQGSLAGMVLGDSYAVGGELPEDGTLTAQLSRLSGQYFYNAGGPQPLRLRSTQALASRLGLHHGIVIYEFLEGHTIDSPPATTPDGGRSKGQRLFLQLVGTSWADRLRTPLNQLHDSPLQGLSVKFEKQLQNELLLPNSFADLVLQERLSNSEQMLFLPVEFKTPQDGGKAATPWAAYFSWYAAELRKDGLDFLVVMIPNRSTIYGPLLAKPRDVSKARAVFLEFARQFQDAGVPTVSLLERYERDASALLPQHEYLYLLDDTHWNARGTQAAAAEILKRLAEASPEFNRP